MIIFNVLADATTGEVQNGTPWNTILTWGLLIVLIALVVIWFVFSGRKNRQRQQEYTEQLDAIRPGHKVKTAGGICGIVAEVCDDNTVIIETGSETTGKSYIKMDKELIAQTDAKGPTQLAREEAEARKKAEREARGKAPEESVKETAPEAEAPVTPDVPEAPEEPVIPGVPEGTDKPE